MFTRFCESQRRFSLISPLNILHTFLSLFPPCCRVSSSLPSSTAPQARGHPRPSLLLPAFPPLVLRCLSCLLCVRPGCLAVCSLSSSPFIPIGRAPEALRRPSACPVVCVSWLLPSLVHHQAQDSVTVWADTPRIYPRPFALLPVMCCRCSFRGLFRGLSCLLSCVVWW